VNFEKEKIKMNGAMLPVEEESPVGEPLDETL
jgi:hypothetical protein